MPSTMAVSSNPGGSYGSDAFLNPWNWIAFIFAIQLAGALAAMSLFALNFSSVVLPVGLLAVGVASALLLGWFDRDDGLGWWKWWIPLVIYALVVFFLSNRSYPEARLTMDTKIFHPLIYLTLGVLLAIAWHPFLKQIGMRGFVCCVQLTGTAYAASDEFHQAFVPGREPAFTDVLIDSAGVALGLGLFLLARFLARPLLAESDRSVKASSLEI